MRLNLIPSKLKAAKSQNAVDRFWRRVSKGSDCWEWTGALKGKGYGAFRWDMSCKHNGKYRMAHRVSWELHYGPIPEGLHVCHHCDNPRCVRPDHLFLGTNLDNIADKMAKGRHVKGESCSWSKLTESQVMEIRATYKRGCQGFGARVLGRRFGVSKQAIYKILRRDHWKHLH